VEKVQWRRTKEEQWRQPKPTQPKSIGANDFVELKKNI